MALTPGTRLGPYEVLAQIGVGGMGEVYKATDINLKRAVAIKVVPTSVAADVDRLARFQREGEILAALNHPNIAAIYGLERSGATTALVMELVEGPTLADRITLGPIPIDEALPIAKQIAEALEAAHEQSIIHRDLKPANIKLRPDGTVKVLDFGIAKAIEGPAIADASNSPTMPAAATRAGVILGTAAYMSPEQAKGKPVDRRTDIWAFGCVLFETLTGRTAFTGETLSDTIAAILEREPDWRTLPNATPKSIERLLRRCLQKGPKGRLHDIADARIEIDDALATPRPIDVPGAATLPRRPWRRVAIAAGTLLVGGAVAGAVIWLEMRPAPSRLTRLTITPSGAAALTVNGNDRDLAISPDGTRVVYVGSKGSQLFVRALDELDPTPLAEPGVPRHPFISPDGTWIGFFDRDTLKKVAMSGGPAVTVCRITTGGPRGATWGPDGTILFATISPSSGLWQVSAAGGEPAVLTTPQRDKRDHWWPEFLPGGRAVLFTIIPAAESIENAQVAVFDLRTSTQKILVRGGSHAHYVRSGHLVYAVAVTLRAVAFDPDRLEVLGTAVPVLEQVVTTPFGAADFDVAGDGTLAYMAGGLQALARTLVWVDRQGHEEPIKAPTRAYTMPRLSPDGTRVALDVRDQQQGIWIWDFTHETLTRFPSTQGAYPVWTPDGRRLVFSSNAGPGLFMQVVDGTTAAERLMQSENFPFLYSMSPDGSRVVFGENAQDLMVLGLQNEQRVQPLVQTPFTEQNGEISADGRWFAYQSNESGPFEIYVRPFPDVNGGRWLVSTGGGTRPLWARNSRELFYLAPSGALMSVRVERGPTWAAATPMKVFEGPYIATASGRSYDVSPDGQRFLMIKRRDSSDQTAAPPTLIVVQNWFEELKRLVPTK